MSDAVTAVDEHDPPEFDPAVGQCACGGYGILIAPSHRSRPDECHQPIETLEESLTDA